MSAPPRHVDARGRVQGSSLPAYGSMAMAKSYRTERDRQIDEHVGERVRLRRILLGHSQEKLADRLGLTFQQVQKYERGSNRIAASRLYKLASILDVPVNFFFDGLDGGPTIAKDLEFSRRELQLVRNFRQILDGSLKEQIYQLVKSLSEVIDAEA